jgi:glyoxylase-like metal-dependent hydrolase (beta-lactamase superfamily II)
MDIKQVGKRGVLFSFDEIGGATNVYVINGVSHIYIIDTFIGPEVMGQINSYIENNMSRKAIIVINTHYHWDHVWGNCTYKYCTIVAHEKCYEFLAAKGEEDLNKHKEYAKGDVNITLPNLTFSEMLMYEEDGVRLIHSPGHTEDSITVYDEQDKVLFVGDNLERPIPFIMSKDLDVYLRTLQSYLEIDFQVVIGGHTGLEGKQLICDNAEYIKSFAEGSVSEPEDEEYKYIHELNIKRRTE